MRAFLSTLSLLIPVSIGAVLVAIIWPRTGPRASMVRLSLSIGVGAGVCSALLLIWLTIAGRAGKGVLGVEIVLSVALGLLAYRNGRAAERGAKGSGPGFLLWGGAGAVLAFAVVTLVLEVLSTPHGDWDAWSSWNLKARIIYLGADHWRDVFSELTT